MSFALFPFFLDTSLTDIASRDITESYSLSNWTPAQQINSPDTQASVDLAKLTYSHKRLDIIRMSSSDVAVTNWSCLYDGVRMQNPICGNGIRE